MENRMLVKSAVAIPAMSIAEIDTYDMINGYLVVKQPTGDSLASEKLVIIPEAIPANGYGKAICFGIGAILVNSGITAGQSVGSGSASWVGKMQDGGPFSVISITGTLAIVRFIGGGGGASRIYAKITRELVREDKLLKIEPVKTYTVKLLDIEDVPAPLWTAGVWVAIDDVRTVGTTKYICKQGHLTHISNKPPCASYWDTFGGDFEAGLLSYKPDQSWGSIDLTFTIPWFNLYDIVEVVHYQRPNDTEPHWYILGAFGNTVYQSPVTGARRFSQASWKNPDGTIRSIACFS